VLLKDVLARLRQTLITPPVPAPLRARHRTFSAADRTQLETGLRERYLAARPPGYLGSDAGRKDLADHLEGRLEKDRCYIIPWLDSLGGLEGRHVLEIGSGTGASTLAMAEQGARVEAVDIDGPSLEIAELRCRLHGLESQVRVSIANAADLPESLARPASYDLVVFYASLEHMTQEERLSAIATTWPLVKPGGHWCIVGTPNRLWHFDYHTSFLPFYFWLPDDLAYAYSSRSPRGGFNDRYRPPADEAGRLDFLRRGRGVSYHEFEIALDGFEGINFPRGLAAHHRHRQPLRRLKHACTLDGKYERLLRLLRRLAPSVPNVFLHKSLDLAMKKPG
jgi:S-adenosylmethionine-dependent methyltransferase